MRKKLGTVLLVACYFVVCCVMPVSAMSSDFMMIQDFEDFFGTSDAIAECFNGYISAQKDMQAVSELSKEYYGDGSQSIMLTGKYTPSDDGKLYGMINPYLQVPKEKSDWTGAKYLQFWCCNKTDILVGVRVELRNAEGTHSLPKDTTFEAYGEKRNGEDVFKVLKDCNDRRVRIPSGFEGMVRIPLSLYSTLTDYTGIQSIYLGMSLSEAEAKPIYFDSFSVVGEGYKNPNPKVYPAEISNAYLRIDEKAGHLIYTAELDTPNAKDSILLEALDASGKSIGVQKFDADAEHYVKAYYKLPEDIAAGQYTLTATVVGNEALKKNYQFPIYNMEPTTYGDVWNTKYEQAVELLSKMGIITGYEDNTFRPDKTITRAEFAALMVRILGLEEEAKAIAEAPFNDTAGHWSAGNIAVGVKNGIINGYGDGNFGPNDSVTYEQAMKMIVAALGYNADAEAAGGYPSGYMTVGESIGIERNITEEKPRAIRGTVAIMLRNAIAAPTKVNGELANISLMNKNFEKKMDELRYKAAVTFGDNILKYSHDNYGTEVTPSMIDGINIFTMQPATFVVNGVKSVTSNFVTQQNALKTLVALSSMTGDPKYKARAVEIVKYNLENHVDNNGTPYMGGHVNWDCFHEKPAWGKGLQLEMKDWYPYYDLWYEVDPTLASRSVGAIWDSAVVDWSVLNFTRHGKYNKAPTKIWDNEWSDPDPWYKVKSELGFYMTGADLMYAAFKEYQHTGNEKAKEWGLRLHGMYEKATDKTTGLIPDLYQLTGSGRDRGLDQFGMDFPEETYGVRASEGNIQDAYQCSCKSIPAMVELYDAGVITDKEMELFVNEHIGFAKYEYDFENHKVKQVLADGTDLTGYVLKADGYFGKTGDTLSSVDPDRFIVWGYTTLYKMYGHQELWDVARDVAKLYDLGDIGTKPGENVKLNLATTSCTLDNVYAMCALYEQTGCEDYLKMAKAISNNSMLMAKRGFFMTLYEKAYQKNWEDKNGWNKVYAKFGDMDALAILRIQEIMEGRSGTIPTYVKTFGNQIDDFDTINRSEVGSETAIFMGEYDIDTIIDKMK